MKRDLSYIMFETQGGIVVLSQLTELNSLYPVH